MILRQTNKMLTSDQRFICMKEFPDNKSCVCGSTSKEMKELFERTNRMNHGYLCVSCGQWFCPTLYAPGTLCVAIHDHNCTNATRVKIELVLTVGGKSHSERSVTWFTDTPEDEERLRSMYLNYCRDSYDYWVEELGSNCVAIKITQV